MAVTSLIKFTQGSNTDTAGRAVKGDMTSGTVIVSNGSDVGVVSWKYELLYVPPGSSIALVVQGPNSTPTFTFSQPDVAGSYRVRLTVTDANGNTDIDIRNFCVPFTNGLIAPPFQGYPSSLPLTGAGSKPNEMNLGGQTNGWDGDANASYPLLYQAIKKLDTVIGGTGIDHNTLSNLTVGDVHTQYVKISGRAGGQTILGGTAASNNLVLQSTSNATRGVVQLADTLDLNTHPISNVTYQDFIPSASPTFQEGRVYYNSADKSLSVQLAGGNVDQQLGQEALVRCVNKTGSTITDGTAVYVSGAQGNRPTISLAASATESAASEILGIATEDIANNAEGFVTVLGVVHGYNTSTFAAGDILYLSATTPGDLQNTAPASPALGIKVAVALNSTNNGSIFVAPQAPRVAAGNGLTKTGNTLSVVAADTTISVGSSGIAVNKITTTNITQGTAYQALVTNSGATASAWQTLTLSVSSPLSITNSGNIVQGASLSIANATTGDVGVIQLAGDLAGTGTSPSVAKINGANVPSAGSLTTGDVLQVSGASALTYAKLGAASITPGTANTVLWSDGTSNSWTGSPTLSTSLTIAGVAAIDASGANFYASAASSSSGNWVLRSLVGNTATAAIYACISPGSATSSNAVMTYNGTNISLSAASNVFVATSGANRFQVGTTIVQIMLPSLLFEASQSAPKFYQGDNTTASATAQTLTVQAQNATGTTSVGGDLLLKGGTGTSSNGAVYVYSGTNIVADFGTGYMNIRASVTVAASVITFAYAGSTKISQTDTATASATGQTLTIQAQNATGTTSTGGALALKGGTGTTAPGAVGIYNGSTQTADFGNGYVNLYASATSSSSGNWVLRSLVGTTTSAALYANMAAGSASSSNYALSCSSSQTSINATTTVALQVAATSILSIAATSATLSVASMLFATAVTSPTLKQSDNTTASATGQTMTIQAQNATGTTATGGDLIVASGTGTSIPGTLYLRTGATTALTLVPGTAYFNQAPVYFMAAAGAPILSQVSSTTASATGLAFSISAQSCTGTTSTGGALNLASGAGTSNQGSINLSAGATLMASLNTTGWTLKYSAIPTAAPSSGNGYLFVDASGALCYWSSSGKITQIAA